MKELGNIEVTAANPDFESELLFQEVRLDDKDHHKFEAPIFLSSEPGYSGICDLQELARCCLGHRCKLLLIKALKDTKHHENHTVKIHYGTSRYCNRFM
jgi:hypothetical protein